MKYKTVIFFVLLLFARISIAAQPVVDLQALKQRSLDIAREAEFETWDKFHKAKEFAELTNHTTQLTKTVATLEHQLTNIEQQLKAMTENLKRANGFDLLTKNLISQLNKEKQSFASLKDSKTGRDLDPKNTDDLNIIVDQIVPPYGDEKIRDIRNYGKYAESYRQRGRKSALQSSERYIHTAEDRIQQVTDVALKVNETQSIKDSMDMNNRLLSELLLEIVKQNVMMARLLKVEASDGYDGEIKDAKIKKIDPAKIRKDRFKPL